MVYSKNVPVPGDLVFIAVLRSGFLFHQLPDTGIGRNDTFYLVGSLGALDLCDLDKFFELIGLLFQI